MVPTKNAAPSEAATPSATEIMENQDNEDDVSILSTKTSSETQSSVVVGSRVASGSSPIGSPTANSTQLKATSKGLEDPTGNNPAGRAVGELIGK
jgi:hypothetical protein